jgi:hypothetical protein
MRNATLTLVLLVAMALPATAVVPSTMNFQGILTDNLGEIVSDGPYSVTFALYSTTTAGTALWSEAQTVTTSNGLFNVILGAAIPIPAEALMDTAAYLEMAVETDPPLSPRTRLTSTAYSVVTSSLIGEGPVDMELSDPSSGAIGTAILDMEKSTETSDRVKVQFHWDSHYPSTGDSSIYDFLVTPDSTYESKRQHRPFTTIKTIDKASPLATELSILSTSNSTDSAAYSRVVSTSDGFLETNTSTSTTAQATGKRQHKPIYFSKEWSATNSSRALDMSSIFTLDSGYTRTVALDDGDVTVEIQQQTNFPEAAVARSRPFVFPHILENRKSQKGSTGDTAATRESVDADSGCTRIATLKKGNHRIVSAERLGAPPEGPTSIPDINRFRASVDETSGDSSMCWCHFDADSGYATRIAVQQGDESMESLDLIGAPPDGAIAIPNLLDARKSGNETAGDTAATWNFVDADSGCGETATLISSDGTTRFSRVAKAPAGTGPGSPTTVFEIGVETNSSTAGSEHAQEVLDLVSGYQQSAGMTKADLISEIAHEASQTREHVLLSRQVGVPTAASTRSVDLQTDDDAASARLERGDATDSSGIDLYAADRAVCEVSRHQI